MRIVLCLLFLLFIITACLFPGNEDQVILILPFINTGMEHRILNETLFTSYFYLYFEQLKSFTAIHPHKILNYKKKYTYNIDDLYTIELLNDLVHTFKCDFILGGEYKIENGILKIDIDIFGKQKKFIVKKNFEIVIDEDERKALSTIAQQMAKAFSGYDPDTASLIVNTDYPCSLYLNDAFLGLTSKRFTLPAGEYDIKIIYTDDYFDEVVYQKQIRLEKGQVYDSGEIQVLVEYEIKANVESGIYCNGKRIGVTDLLLHLPAGNEYDIEIVYTDNHNDKRYKSEHISTKDGEDGEIEIEFSNRIKMENGTLPFSGTIGEEIVKLPYVFDNLESRTYHAQITLEDPEWKKKWIIYKERVTLNIAKTAIIDKSDFVYKKYWGLCFIPGAAQFYNFEKAKGTVILTLSALSLVESITAYFLIQSTGGNVRRRDVYKIASWGGIAFFGGIYIYSCIDGIVTMGHLYRLFYPD